LLRAGLSIAANIAEGYGGSGGRAFTNYLTIARRSAFETENWLLVAKDAVLIEENEYRSSVSLLRECTAMLSAMIRRLSQDS
jgi:four helix bundle protein